MPCFLISIGKFKIISSNYPLFITLCFEDARLKLSNFTYSYFYKSGSHLICTLPFISPNFMTYLVQPIIKSILVSIWPKLCLIWKHLLSLACYFIFLIFWLKLLLWLVYCVTISVLHTQQTTHLSLDKECGLVWLLSITFLDVVDLSRRDFFKRYWWCHNQSFDVFLRFFFLSLIFSYCNLYQPI